MKGGKVGGREEELDTKLVWELRRVATHFAVRYSVKDGISILWSCDCGHNWVGFIEGITQ